MFLANGMSALVEAAAGFQKMEPQGLSAAIIVCCERRGYMSVACYFL
jgi:hypothetical protein